MVFYESYVSSLVFELFEHIALGITPPPPPTILFDVLEPRQ